MPLTFNIGSDHQIEVRQTFDAPVVYLDHWAIRRFSNDNRLQNRFVTTLHKVGGTLLLSHQNFAEFSVPDDMKNSVQAELFLDRVLPNVFFAWAGVDKAIEQEVQSGNNSNLPPPPDRELLKWIATNRPNGLNSFTFKGMLTVVADSRDRLRKVFQESNQNIADSVNAQRYNPEFVKKARNFKASQDIPRTQVVMGEILRSIILDTRAPFTDRDAADYQHAILSTCYCDFVLLDGRWHDMVKRMESRLAKLDFKFRHARCFSERRNGLENFLLALDVYGES